MRALLTTLTALGLGAACPCTCGSTSSAAPDPSHPAPGAVADHRATFTVKRMSCHGCATAVVNAAKKPAGVRRVDVDLAKKQAVVSFDASQTTAETIRRAIEAAGYPATLVADVAN